MRAARISGGPFGVAWNGFVNCAAGIFVFAPDDDELAMGRADFALVGFDELFPEFNEGGGETPRIGVPPIDACFSFVDQDAPVAGFKKGIIFSDKRVFGEAANALETVGLKACFLLNVGSGVHGAEHMKEAADIFADGFRQPGEEGEIVLRNCEGGCRGLARIGLSYRFRSVLFD
jgi:hypothetical protein